MKRFKLLLCILLIASTQSEAKGIRAIFSYAAFNLPDADPYIETYLSIDAGSIQYTKNVDSKFQGSLQININCYEGGQLVKSDAYNLMSPELSDTTNIRFNIIDQNRISLPNGSYRYELSIRDNNDTSKTAFIETPILIHFPKNKISISDIAFIESYKSTTQASGKNIRNGMEMIPNADNFYPTSINKLIFYSEIYNANTLGENETALLSYYIENVGSTGAIDKYTQIKKVLVKPVLVVMSEYDIQLLPSGNYNVTVELRNKSNELLVQKKAFFQRSNQSVKPITDMHSIDVANTFASKYTSEQMIEHIRSLAPIVHTDEQRYIRTLLENPDLVNMQQFFVFFWEKRNALEPEKEWQAYEKKVQAVHELYSSRFRKGYDTDRGIIYLRYGPPNAIRKNDFDNQTFPYEIWHYYQIKTYSNRRFVFFSPDNLQNDLELLHSDLPGEKNDPQWKYKITARTYKNSDGSENSQSSYYGSKLEQDYNE